MRNVKLALLMALVALVGFYGGWLAGNPDPYTGTADVSNAFWASVVSDASPTSHEPPESDCKEVVSGMYRCYARWAPTGGDQVLIYQAEVNVYPDGRIVVGRLQHHVEPPAS